MRLFTIQNYIHKYQGGAKSVSIGTAIGRDSEGRFLTSATKEYPESLNKAIAKAIKDTLHSNEHARETHVPTQQQYDEATRHSTLHQQYDPYDPTTFQSMREDYANHSATGSKSSVLNEDMIRHQANCFAESLLAKVNGITNDDILELLRRWSFSKNRKRTNVLPAGRSWVHSDTFGLVSNAATNGPVVTLLAQHFPAIAAACHKWASQHPQWIHGSIPCTSLTLNKGYAAAPHRDKGNYGPSVAAAIGQHSGGRLAVWRQDDGISDISEAAKSASTLLDTTERPQVFDGNQLHSVEPFAGERFSMIFFTCKAAIQADEDAKEQLNQQIRDCTGFTIPSKLQLQQLMLHVSTPVLPSPISPAEEIIDQILAATNPHEVLQLSRGCDLATARASYKNLARVIHPDKTADPRAEEAFKLVHQALQAVTCAASTTAAATACRYNTTRDKSNMHADHFPNY